MCWNLSDGPEKALESGTTELVIRTDKGWLQGMSTDGRGVFTSKVEEARKWRKADTTTLIQYLKELRPDFKIIDVALVATRIEVSYMPMDVFLNLVNEGTIHLLS